MNPIRAYVLDLPDSEKILCIDGYEKFERDGFIGSEPIRVHAESVTENIGVDGVSIILVMRDIGIECYRYFAKRYLKENE